MPEQPKHLVPVAYHPRQAAQVLGIGVTKLYAEMAAGKIKAKRFGRRTLVPVTELQAWINALPGHEFPEREAA
ncbi:helix-turn-helix domain-containing protein [Bosea sp. UC22_33]|uniref:helix-turn-helix domain-containing protein n=1 Tax=Bosea sp. UC22_33 TaxID=3350165 RepID=UPI00366B1A92